MLKKFKLDIKTLAETCMSCSCVKQSAPRNYRFYHGIRMWKVKKVC